MEFEWDPKKSETNRKKHASSFPDAATLFADPLAITFSDPDHSHGEHWLLTFGQSKMNLCSSSCILNGVVKPE